MFFVDRAGDKCTQAKIRSRKVECLREVSGFQCDYPITFRVLPVFPEGPIKARNQHNQDVSIREPVLLPDSLHDEIIGAFNPRDKLQRMNICTIVIDACRQPFHMPNQDVSLNWMQAAARRNIFFQEN